MMQRDKEIQILHISFGGLKKHSFSAEDFDQFIKWKFQFYWIYTIRLHERFTNFIVVCHQIIEASEQYIGKDALQSNAFHRDYGFIHLLIKALKFNAVWY